MHLQRSVNKSGDLRCESIAVAGLQRPLAAADFTDPGGTKGLCDFGRLEQLDVRTLIGLSIRYANACISHDLLISHIFHDESSKGIRFRNRIPEGISDL